MAPSNGENLTATDMRETIARLGRYSEHECDSMDKAAFREVIRNLCVRVIFYEARMAADAVAVHAERAPDAP